MTSHYRTFFRKISKLLGDLNEVFNFKYILIYVLPEFNLNPICASCCLYYLRENLTQDVYNDIFTDVNNEFDVTNFLKLNILV